MEQIQGRYDAESMRAMADGMQADYKRLSSLAKRLSSSIAGKGGAFLAASLLADVQQAIAQVAEDRAHVEAAAAALGWERVPQDFELLGTEVGRMEAEARAQAIAAAATPFLHLETSDRVVQAALTEAQATLEKTLKLRKRLPKMQGDAEDSVTRLKEQLAPYQTFVQALASQDVEEKITCLRALMGSGVFSNALLGALTIAGKLHLAGVAAADVATTENASGAAGEKEAAGAAETPAASGATNVAATTEATGTIAATEATATTKATKATEATEATEAAPVNAPEKKQKAKQAKQAKPKKQPKPAEDPEARARAARQLWESWSAQGLLLPEDYDYGELTSEASPKAAAKIGAKAFLSDLDRPPMNVVDCAKRILKKLDASSVIDRAYIEEVGDEKWKPEVYDAAFDRLCRLGCLRTYTLAGCGTFYALTERMAQLYAMAMVRSHLGLPLKGKRHHVGEIADRAAHAAARLAFARVHAHHAHALAEAGEEAHAFDIVHTMGGARMGAPLYQNGVHGVVYWFAGESVREEDPLRAREAVDTLFAQEHGALRDLTLAGMEREPLTCLRQALRKDHPELADVPTYYYLLSEDAFYDSAWEPAPDWFGLDAPETDEDAEEEDEEKEEVDVLTSDTDEGDTEQVAQETADVATSSNEDEVQDVADFVEADEDASDVASEDGTEDGTDDIPAVAAATDEPADQGGFVATDADVTDVADAAEPADDGAPLVFDAPEAPKAAPVLAPVALDDPAAVMDGAIAILERGNLPAAAAYLGFCARIAPDAWTVPYHRLASAIDDPACPPSHRAGDLFGLFSTPETVFDEYLAAAAALRAYVSNDVPHDYDMQRLQAGLLDELTVIDRCTPLKNLLYKLMEFKLQKKKGIDYYADYRRKDQKDVERQRRQIQQDAQTIYDTRVIAPIKVNVLMRRFLDTKKYLYRKGGGLAKMLLAVIMGGEGSAEEVGRFVDETFCHASDGPRTVNDQCVDDYIDVAWDDVRNPIEKRSDVLIGKLRSSLHNEIAGVADVLCRWADLGAGEAVALDDADYQRARGGVLDDLHATAEVEGERLADTDDVMERAGIEVLFAALKELEERLGGSFQPSRTRYFYIDFLRSTDLLLDENLLPDYRAWYPSDAAAHYLAAVQAYAMTVPPSFAERLDDIFSGLGDGSDDYQTARLIDAYLTVKDGTSYIAAHGYSIEKNAPYAQSAAKRRYDRFEEELEFAQSCGQITRMGDDETKKESILALIDDCYRYACETQNYGVFRRTAKAFQAQIAEDARAHGEELQHELDACRAGGALDAAHTAFLDAAQKTLDAQNYTVAEDMLRRWSNDDVDLAGTPFDEKGDHLRRFLESRTYSDLYRRVSDGGTPLSKLLGSSSYVPRNKKGRGAQELSKNWIKNPMDGDQMKRLLSALGWDVDRATLQEESLADLESGRRGKRILFRVTLEASANHARSRYQHPIAIFGSEAERDGFRAVCLFGQYDADNLVATCSRLSATLHTIIFLDYALNLQQRRRLARKMKEARLGKTFAVVDRVVIAYLFRNYDEIQVNRMLMMLIMPFAACQPYVPDSGQPMPPEMFMGRKEDLRAVESPGGVNILYGGRQLGKSALLKMAQNDLDHDEAGDRAILIDLHDVPSIGAAARAVSQELTDLHFFKGDGIETDDWDQLARAITQRLRDPAPRIPYFLLMLDEADAFIEECAAVNYHPFDALKRVQQNGSAQFKFVIAGLHNIVRFSKAALGDNSVLAHLTHCTVKPFRFYEARELLETPLRYLGFRFPKEAESLISLILAHANYFPGLIQLYCKELIRTLSKENYAGYSESQTPPYEITRDHVRAVLTNHAFLDQVREKFMITLRLDSDKYYYIIAYLMASLYHKEGSRGFLPEEIAKAAEEYEFEQFRTLTRERLVAFLEELAELNVLRGNADGRYFFNRYSFFQMLGSREDVEAKLYALALGEEELA